VAETENDNRRSLRPIKWRTIVVLPAPLGAEKMIALPCDMVRGVGRMQKYR
jgi:hypothetical protein